MNDREEEVRALIARQAADWFLAQREGNLGVRESKAFEEWVLASPVHVAEYLGVTAVALALPTAADDPECPLAKVLERVRTTDDADVRPLRTDLAAPAPPRTIPERTSIWHRWQYAAAAIVVAAIGTLVWLNATSVVPQRYATGHGEQRSWSLADTSVLRLNTDTAVTVRYGRAERLVEIAHGQAYFEVAHEAARRFRVVAGMTKVVAVGTQFDIHKYNDLTVVTVVAGRVLVSSSNEPQRELPVADGEQVRVMAGVLPEHATPVDALRRVAWLQHQIAVDQEPLAAVVAEFNRYGTVPIDIETPSLETLQISGVFNIGDTDTFIAFLRTLNGVTVDTTPTGFHVSAHEHRRNAGPGVSSGAK